MKLQNDPWPVYFIYTLQIILMLDPSTPLQTGHVTLLDIGGSYTRSAFDYLPTVCITPTGADFIA